MTGAGGSGPRSPRDIGALLRDSLAFLRERPGAYLLVASAFIVPVNLVVSGVGLEQLWEPFDSSPPLAANTVPLLAGFLVTTPLVTAACIQIMGGRPAGEPARPGQAVLRALELFSPLFLALVLVALGVAVGLLLFIAPGVYLFVRWFFAAQAVVLDGRQGPAALRRSAEVVEDSWWRTFGMIVLAQLIAFLPGLLVAGPFQALAAAADREVLALVGTILAETLTTPFLAIFATLLYHDLGARQAAAF